jgi:hypothetical protein
MQASMSGIPLLMLRRTMKRGAGSDGWIRIR